MEIGQWMQGLHTYHEHPWYFVVIVQVERGVVWYVQVRLLLRCSTQGLLHVGMQTMNVAFVWVFYDSNDSEWSRLLGCKDLSFSVPDYFNIIQSIQQRRPSYMIVNCRNFLKAIHVVPHFCEHDVYFEIEWKFWHDW